MMKKLFLLIGLVVFLTPIVVSAKSSLPKCEIKKNEVITQKACYGKITKKDKYKCQKFKYKGEFKFGKFNGKGTLSCDVKDKWRGEEYVGEWKDDKKHGSGIWTKKDRFTYNGEFAFDKFNGKGSIIYYSSNYNYIGEWKNGKKHGFGRITNADGTIENVQWENNIIVKDKIENEIIKAVLSDKEWDKYKEEVEKQMDLLPVRLSPYERLAIGLGCNPAKIEKLEGCLNRKWPPAQANTGDAWDAESRRSQQQAQNTDGYYKEQSNGQFVWVDTRSGAEKFTDKFCINCTSAQVYMINRATKKYFQGAPLSGWDKFVLRGGNTKKVIKFNK